MHFKCSRSVVNGNEWSRMTGAVTYEGWNFNSGNYLFTTDTK